VGVNPNTSIHRINNRNRECELGIPAAGGENVRPLTSPAETVSSMPYQIISAP
jgi:hypothetical protein